MTQQPTRTPQSPSEAAFFFRGPSEVVAEGVVFFPSFGTCTAFLCDGRILLVDTSSDRFAPAVLDDLRKNHSQAPIEAVVYTYGHIDHIGGAPAFLADAQARGQPRL